MVAPVGTGTVILVALQAVGVPAVPLNLTVLVPCVAPKFVPVIRTEVPTVPDVGFKLVMLGAGAVTVKLTPLLATPPTVTTTFPVVAPVGTGTVILVALQAVGVPAVPLNLTVLVPCVAPKFVPVIRTEVPIVPDVGFKLVIVGAGAVTVKFTPLLATPPTVTTTFPVVAPVGTGTVILVALQAVTVPAAPLNLTVLVPCVAPKFVPVIRTEVPTVPDVGFKLVMLGAGAVTVKLTPLLATPPTVTTTFPVVAPVGTGTVILVALQAVAVPAVPLNLTVLVPWVAPKFVPVMITELPTGPELGLKLAMFIRAVVTVKLTPLLATPPTVTTTFPVVAPLGTGTVILVALQAVTVPAVPLNLTVLVPCVAPKFVPVMITELPTVPDVGFKLVMLGAGAVTVKLTPLLATPPTVTTTFPVVAPVGTGTVILVALQAVAVPAVPLKVTALVPCVAPKFVPVIRTEVPTVPDVGFKLVMLGAGAVTVKFTPLLATPPTVTTTFPVVAPVGTGTVILVALQAVGVPAVPLNLTVLVPCVAPKFVPVIITELPTGPELGLKLAMFIRAVVTVKLTPLLATPPTVTTTFPVVAPLGTGTVILVALQAVAVPAVPLKVTALVPCVAPKFVPVMITELPTVPDVGFKLVMLGAGAVTVKLTPLLATPPTVTTTFPVVAPVGTGTVILVALQAVTVPAVPLKVTALVPCVAPKFVPVMITELPTVPDVGFKLVMLGAGAVTVKFTPLLATPPTVTTTFPVVAPVGTGTVILVALQVVTVPAVPLNLTVLVPCVAPKFVPVMITELPTVPDVGFKLVMLGAGAVTVKLTPLLATPPTVTTTFPVVAPVGTGTVILVALQAVGVPAVPLKVTALVPCAAPKFVPVMITELPTGPDVGLRLAILSTGSVGPPLFVADAQPCSMVTIANNKASVARNVLMRSVIITTLRDVKGCAD